MTKGVVYTCLFGWKEDLKFRPFEGSSADFIVFSDKDIPVPPGCRLIVIKDTGIGPERLSRKPKVLPHRFLGDYDWSLYIDNKVKLKKRPEDIYAEYLAEADVSYVCFSSRVRQCAYQEGEAVIAGGYDKEECVREQMGFYQKQGFPTQFGVSSGTVLLRKHNEQSVIKHHEDWYEHILRFSKRDQLSFDYLRWYHKLPVSNFKGSILTGNDIAEWLQIKRLLPNFNPQDFAWLAGLGDQLSDDSIRKTALSAAKKGNLPKRYTWQLDRIFNRYKSDRGNLCYNAHGYAYVYESVLRYLKDEQFLLLEAGQFSNGFNNSIPRHRPGNIPSLYAWSEFFKKAKIIGFDVRKIEVPASQRRISAYQGDPSSKQDILQTLERIGEPPRVVIENASHASHHQQTFLENIINRVADGGHVFVESLHHQPPQLEKPDAPKTLDLLRSLAAGEVMMSPYISEEAQQNIIARAEKIEFSDSRETFTGQIHTDALCHIKILD
jgi:hypothetical protein